MSENLITLPPENTDSWVMNLQSGTIYRDGSTQDLPPENTSGWVMDFRSMTIYPDEPLQDLSPQGSFPPDNSKQSLVLTTEECFNALLERLNGAFKKIFDQTTLSSATIHDLTVMGKDPKIALANVHLERQLPENNHHPYRPIKVKCLIPVKAGSHWDIRIKGQEYVCKSVSPLVPLVHQTEALTSKQYFPEEISFNPFSRFSRLPQAAQNLANPVWWIGSLLELLDPDPAPGIVELDLRGDKLVSSVIDPLAFMFVSKIPGIAGVNKRLAEITAKASLLLAMHPQAFEEIAKSIEIGSKLQESALRVLNPRALRLMKKLQKEWKDTLQQGLSILEARGDVDENTREVINRAGGSLFQGI